MYKRKAPALSISGYAGALFFNACKGDYAFRCDQPVFKPTTK